MRRSPLDTRIAPGRIASDESVRHIGIFVNRPPSLEHS